MDRPFTSCLPPYILTHVQRGTMKTTYRGIPFLKNPFDIVLYMQLLARQGTQTVIEIGTKYGGSALWFADMLGLHGVASPKVVSVDFRPISTIVDARIQFVKGFASDLGACLSSTLLEALPRPWLVVEDSSHYYGDSLATLNFFHQHLRAGDYIVVEDGILGQMREPAFKKYANGPNRAVADFLSQHADSYEIDASLCDHFGPNATYNPNGWLKKL